MANEELSLALITPSYAPDLELCIDLAKSVLRYTSPDVTHYIIVPARDLPAFKRVSGQRTIVQNARSYLPGSMQKIPGANCWLNLHHPFPPVRGWVAQQIVKLASAAAMDTDVVLLVDSDVVLTREVSGRSFARAGELELFESPNAIDSSLPRHRVWHAVARRLLGLPPITEDKLPDYICWPCAWSPSIVRGMLQRVESVTGKSWATAVGSELHFSEMILYGVYVRDFLGVAASPPVTSSMRCINHSEESALDEAGLRLLVEGAGADDLAIMVSAKSGTPLDVRRRVLTSFHASES